MLSSFTSGEFTCLCWWRSGWLLYFLHVCVCVSFWFILVMLIASSARVPPGTLHKNYIASHWSLSLSLTQHTHTHFLFRSHSPPPFTVSTLCPAAHEHMTLLRLPCAWSPLPSRPAWAILMPHFWFSLHEGHLLVLKMAPYGLLTDVTTEDIST